MAQWNRGTMVQRHSDTVERRHSKQWQSGSEAQSHRGTVASVKAEAQWSNKTILKWDSDIVKQRWSGTELQRNYGTMAL